MGGNSPSLLSYTDVQAAFDKAIASEKGVILRFDTAQARNRFMFRAFTFRGLDRKNNKVLYPEPAHTMHGRSIYDTLSLAKRDLEGVYRLEIKKITQEFEIEEL